MSVDRFVSSDGSMWNVPLELGRSSGGSPQYRSAGTRVEPPPAPEFLSNEDGDIFWIRGDLAENHGKARYMAWTGYDLPVGFRECGVGRLIDLRVRKVYVRDAAVYAPGQEEIYDRDFSWFPCRAEDPGAVAFWEVSA